MGAHQVIIPLAHNTASREMAALALADAPDGWVVHIVPRKVRTRPVDACQLDWIDLPCIPAETDEDEPNNITHSVARTAYITVQQPRICTTKGAWKQHARYLRIIRKVTSGNLSAPFFRALILTARTPSAVLGISPGAAPDLIRIAEQSMRAHAKRMQMDTHIVISTIERAATLLLAKTEKIRR